MRLMLGYHYSSNLLLIFLREETAQAVSSRGKSFKFDVCQIEATQDF